MSHASTARATGCATTSASSLTARRALAFAGSGGRCVRSPPPPTILRLSLDVRCARKPTRLSNNKKKAKLEKTRGRPKRGRGGGGAASPGGLSPQQRVDAANHEARRWLGQHFLIDHSVILDAVVAADVRPDDRILEIGPGTGNLTVELLKAGARVTAVEKDRSLADKLVTTFAEEENLRVHEADFLKWNVVESFADVTAAVAARTGDPDEPDARAKVVANIPYNITTDILKTLLPMGDTFSNMVFMFQEEVAQRLIRDEAGAGDYRPMSVRVHYYSEPYYIRPVTAACFDPPPNVESCLIGFKPRRSEDLLPLRGTEKQFFTFVQACFAQKRKMLKNNLKAVCDDETIVAAFERMGRHDKTRAQELTMAEYVDLFNFVRERGHARGGGKSRAGEEGAAREGRRESAREREERAKVERATSRLVAQAVGRAETSDGDDKGGEIDEDPSSRDSTR